MIQPHHSWSLALRAALLVPALAAPAAAKFVLRLDEPKEPLASRQEATFQAFEVTAAGALRPTAVLWSAAEVIEAGGARRFRGVWPGGPEVRFEPDERGGRASFAAPGLGEGLRTFQIRAAAAQCPEVHVCIEVKVRSGSGAVVETKNQDVSRIPGRDAERAAAVESKGAAVGAAPMEEGLAWETPFRLRAAESEDAFVPRAFQFFKGKPCLAGYHQRRAGRDYDPARLGTDDEVASILNEENWKAFRSSITFPMACLGDGSVVLPTDGGEVIRRFAADGTSKILAGTEHQVDGDGRPVPPQEDPLLVVAGLAAFQDGSVVIADRAAGTDQLRRIDPAGTRQTLTGGGAGEIFTGDGQDLSQDRPATTVRLGPVHALAAAPDGRLLIIGRSGLLVLAPDGVLHPLDAQGWLMVATTDNRVVFKSLSMDLRSLPLCQGGAGREPLRLTRPGWDGGGEPAPLARGPLAATAGCSLGEIRRMMPAPGGGLLLESGDHDHVWYLARPGGDRELARLVASILGAVENAGADGEALGLAMERRAILARVAEADPHRPASLPCYLQVLLSKDKQGLRGGRTPEGKALPQLSDPLQRHIDSFVMDYPSLVLRAVVALHVLDRKIASLPAAQEAPDQGAAAADEVKVEAAEDSDGES